MSGSKKRRLHQKLAKHPHKKLPQVPSHYFTRPCVPPPTCYQGHEENKQHYEYKVFLAETIRDRLPYVTINYEYDGLPPFWHERYNRLLTYTPDIFVSWVDDYTKAVYYSDVEINGLIHYKNRDQILKVKERKDHIYPHLQSRKEPNKEDYVTVASYIVVEVDDFKYEPITDLYRRVKDVVFTGGVEPLNFDKILVAYLKVAA